MEEDREFKTSLCGILKKKKEKRSEIGTGVLLRNRKGTSGRGIGENNGGKYNESTLITYMKCQNETHCFETHLFTLIKKRKSLLH